MIEKLFKEQIIGFKSNLFKALGDNNRLLIIEALREGELCQCEIIPLLGKSQPAVSRHLKILEKSGLIKSRRDGNKILYDIVDHRIFELVDFLNVDLMKTISKELSPIFI
jgi:ArsR family transcriptional regulator